MDQKEQRSRLRKDLIEAIHDIVEAARHRAGNRSGIYECVICEHRFVLDDAVRFGDLPESCQNVWPGSPDSSHLIGGKDWTVCPHCFMPSLPVGDGDGKASKIAAG